MNKLKIEQINPEKLVPYANNARTHTAEQIGQIAGSIAEFGFVNPILIGEGDVIIAGHGRLLVAQKLGLYQSSIPTAYLLCLKMPSFNLKKFTRRPRYAELFKIK